MPGGLLLVHDVFPDPADGGRPPYHVVLRALDEGFVPVSEHGSLRVLRRPGARTRRAGQSRGAPAADDQRPAGAVGGGAGRPDRPDAPAVGRELVSAGLATSSRFTRQDCWTRTTRGAQVVAQLRA